MNKKLKNILAEIANIDASDKYDKINQIIDICNQSVKHGFIDLPMLKDGGANLEDGALKVWFAPVSGMVSLSDLINIKSVWGVDDLAVSPSTNNDIFIELTYSL